jgi:hypothetical protein
MSKNSVLEVCDLLASNYFGQQGLFIIFIDHSF